MNKKPDSIELIEARFESWLQANEVSDLPSTAFRQRLQKEMHSATVIKLSDEKGTESPIGYFRSRWSFWFAGATAIAAVLTLVVASQVLLLPDNSLVSDSIWQAAEFEFYAVMLEPIDAEVLTEISELLNFY